MWVQFPTAAVWENKGECPAPGLQRVLHCCSSRGLTQMKAVTHCAMLPKSLNTTCSGAMCSTRTSTLWAKFHGICQIMTKVRTDPCSSSCGFIHFSDLDEQVDGPHTTPEYVGCAFLPVLNVHPKPFSPPLLPFSLGFKAVIGTVHWCS